MAKLKSGDSVTSECTEVDALPITALQSDGGTLKAIEGEGVTQKGKLLLSSRKDDYIAAFAEQGLTICEDNHDFATLSEVTRLHLKSGKQIQYYQSGRTFDSIDTDNDPVFTRYWKFIWESAINFAASSTRKHCVCLTGPSFNYSDIQKLYNLLGNKPGDMELYVLRSDVTHTYTVGGTVEETEAYIQNLTREDGTFEPRFEDTAVIVIPPLWVSSPQVTDDDFFDAVGLFWQNLTHSGANKNLQSYFRHGGAMLCFALVGYNGGSLDIKDDIYGWWTIAFVVPQQIEFVSYSNYLTDAYRDNCSGDHAQTEKGIELFGTQTSITGSDTARIRFDVLDEEDLNNYGLYVTAKQGSDNVEVAGTFTEAYWTFLEDNILFGPIE